MSEAKITEARPSDTISGPGASAAGLADMMLLKRSTAKSATLRRSPDSTAEMGVGQPGVQRHEADLRAVAEQQEHEREVEERGIEGGCPCHQHVPRHRVQSLADHRARREVHEDGAKQRERDADAAQQKVLPRRLQRRGRAVDADHQHGGEGGELHRHPHQPDVVGEQRQVHAEHQRLVHRVVEAQVLVREVADLQLVRDVARAEDAGGEADERAEKDEHRVQVVDDQERPGLRPLLQQQERTDEGQERHHHIEAGAHALVRQEREHRRAEQRDGEQPGQHQQARWVHGCSPRCSCSRWMSTVSKRSRMRKRKMPMTISATRMEKATLISTTSGMPFAPVAARIRPFSIDMKPITWLTALRREIIIKRPSRITDSANDRSSRASVPACAVIGSITMIASATRPMPASIVSPMLTTGSIVRWIPRRTTMRCSTSGITIALTLSAMPAVMYRCGASWM